MIDRGKQMTEDTSSPEGSPLELLVVDSRHESEQVQRELTEIDLLIQQSTGEVDKLARRHARATNHLRHIQTNLETVPREDIRDAYDAVQDAQQRLFTMRGQLEKLQSNQLNRERYMTLLSRLLEVVEGKEGAVAGAPAGHSDGGLPTTVRVVEAQEAERRRLSRAMHDGPAQSMTNLILQAEICHRLFDSHPEQSREELAALKSSATNTFQRIRDFIFELRPMMLDDLGLVPTMRRYAEMFNNKHGIPVEVTVVGKDRRLEPHVEVTVFRIVQELLGNVRDHAQASHVRLTLEIDDQWVMAAVDDNGVGFNVEEAVSAARQQRTIGLSTVHERVEMLGGTVGMESNPGKGTHVEVTIPVSVE